MRAGTLAQAPAGVSAISHSFCEVALSLDPRKLRRAWKLFCGAKNETFHTSFLSGQFLFCLVIIYPSVPEVKKLTRD